MLNRFSTRSATRGDTPAIREICRVSFGPIYRYFADQSLNSEGPVFVSEIDGLLVGFVKLVQTPINNNPVGDILWLAVLPAFRRRNIGSDLIASSVEYFENQRIHPIHASVDYRNKPALALFQRNGFHRISFHGLVKQYGSSILKFYSKFWVAPTEVVLMYCGSLKE